MTLYVYDKEGNQTITVETVDVSERPTHSPVLGPNGKPLQYAPPPPFGFAPSKRTPPRA